MRWELSLIRDSSYRLIGSSSLQLTSTVLRAFGLRKEPSAKMAVNKA
jgi:hypothetical protein